MSLVLKVVRVYGVWLAMGAALWVAVWLGIGVASLVLTYL